MNSKVKRLPLFLSVLAWLCSLPSVVLSEQYRVRKGDTLAKLARRYHVPLPQLIADNPMRNPNELHLGQPLTIPERYHTIPTTPMRRPPSRPSEHPINDPARTQQLRTGLQHGWVVTQNPDTPRKLFVHKRMVGGVLEDLQYLIEVSPDGEYWTVYTPQVSVGGRTEYGRRVGVMEADTTVPIGSCNCP